MNHLEAHQPDRTPKGAVSISEKQSGNLAAIVSLMPRLAVVFFASLIIVTGSMSYIYPSDPTGSPDIDSLSSNYTVPIASLVISVAITFLDTLQHLRKR